MNNANLKQVGGGHYGGLAFQHWDYVVHCLKGRYLEGNISRYVDQRINIPNAFGDAELETVLGRCQTMLETIERIWEKSS